LIITTLLIIHALLAVALLGAITHQAVSVWLPARRPAGSFVGRFRSVAAPSYANAIVVLYVCTAVVGGILIYPEFRLSVRPVLEQLGLWAALGAFDLKEHFTVIGMATLPAYWYFWRQPLAEQHARTRAALTALLAFIVWWNFLVGHILNNIRGFGS
jgi:hypothetical protein